MADADIVVEMPDVFMTNELKGFSGTEDNAKIRGQRIFRLVTPYVRNKVVPLPYGTDQATTRHSSGCAYRQLRCCKF